MLKQLLCSLALMGASAVFATEGVSEMAEQLFGKEEAGKRVSEGVVFIDGQFVRGPYSVTREGNVILVNGRIASRFKVEAAAAKAAAAAGDGHSASGSESDVVSEEEGEAIGSEPAPTLDDAPAAKGAAAPKTSAIDAKLAKQKGGGSIEERLAAKKRSKDLKAASATGSFNSEASGADPMALFEEADYTYTPPSKPEPPAVPYVRPAAQKPMAERMAEARKKDAAATQKAMTVKADEPAAEEGDDEGGDLIAVESFDDLTEEEIDAYTKKFTARRAEIEKTLAADGLVCLSSATSGMKSVKRTTAWRFVLQYEELCAAKDASKLQGKWGTTLPRGYLQKMYDNRTENLKNMKTLTSRIKRSDKAAKERAKNRL